MQTPFSSLTEFRQQFNQGLCSLLDKQQLGTFILCLANASNDADLFAQLKDQLNIEFQRLLTQYKGALKNGEQINAVEEDLLVFLKLHTLGLDQIQLTQHRDEGIWNCQFNQLRSFRPRRMTNFAHNGEMFTPFVESQFHFNKPFMAKECFWSGEIQHKQIDLFYNKYPFADLHGLIVPDRDACMPQYLSQDVHEYIWQLTRLFEQTLPGVALGYNSYGAYASVNHLHFQMFINPRGLPISHAKWRHNGGEVDYPVKVTVCHSEGESWPVISGLHKKRQAYNLLYTPGKLYIIPRKVQGEAEVPTWSSGFTWYEMCGAMLVSSHQDYAALSEADIQQYLFNNRL